MLRFVLFATFYIEVQLKCDRSSHRMVQMCVGYCEVSQQRRVETITKTHLWYFSRESSSKTFLKTFRRLLKTSIGPVGLLVCRMGVHGLLTQPDHHQGF